MLVSDDDVVYDCELNQQDRSTNTDKFYVMQVLVNGSEDMWVVHKHFGRTGTKGQVKNDEFDTEERAIEAFEKIFKDKTGWKWEDREKFTKKKNKYNHKIPRKCQ